MIIQSTFFSINNFEPKGIVISYSRHPKEPELGEAYVDDRGRLRTVKLKDFFYTFTIRVNTKSEVFRKLKDMVYNHFSYSKNADFSSIMFTTNGLQVKSNKAYFKEDAEINKEKNEAIFRIRTVKGSVKEIINRY